MRLWLLKRRLDRPEYDAADGFVIRAEDEFHARAWAAANAGDEKPITWTESALSTCDPLEQDGKSGVILIDFNAG